MIFLQAELFCFVVFVIDFAQAEVSPAEENVCLETETYEEKTTVTVLTPKEITKKEWCFSLWNHFRCEKKIKTWINEKKPRIISKKRIVPKCCIGYKEEEKKNTTKCVPECLKGCLHGECIAPELCACKPGFYGPLCKEVCPRGFWGENCRNKCVCSSSANCHPVFGRCYCEPGWRGDRCELPCQSGYFGDLCKYECNCDGQLCDHKTGECIALPVLDITVTSTTEISSTHALTEADCSTTHEIFLTKIQLFKANKEKFTSKVSSETTTEEINPIIAITDPFIPDTTELKEMNLLEKANLDKDTADENMSTELISNMTGSFNDVNKTVIISATETTKKEFKIEGFPNSWNTENVDYIESEVTIKKKKIFESETLNENNKNNTTLISFNPTEQSELINETDNFIGEHQRDLDEEILPMFFRFLPTFSVLFGISFVTFITAAGWVIVKHQKKNKIILSTTTYKDTVFELEEKVSQHADFFWASNYVKSNAHLSDPDLKNATPVLKTFKPLAENKIFISKDR